MSSTIEKKPRQKVVASFATFAEFEVPEGIDLKNEKQVENWWIKWGTLHIKLVGKDELMTVEWKYEPETDYKHPDTTEVEEVEEEEDEEDDE